MSLRPQIRRPLRHRVGETMTFIASGISGAAVGLMLPTPAALAVSGGLLVAAWMAMRSARWV